MKIFAIETSCDETAIALVEASGGLKNPSFKIMKNLVASQIKIHRPFGGVVPNLAKREHLKNLPILYRKIFANPKSEIRNSKQILNSKSKILNSIDIVAVTVGPGLEPALWTGINFAKKIYQTLNPKPHTPYPKIIGVNHLEGHLYSFLLKQKTKFPISNFKFQMNIFPAIALLVSGGHTILIKMDSLEKFKKIGETRDDAIGEAFDKVARLLGLSYPGGPEIEKFAKKGNPDAINFPRPMINQKNYDFSFSGLKTAILYYLKDNKNYKKEDVAASFQKAAFDVLIKKTLRAAEEFNAKSIMISGGVAANKTLRKEFGKKLKAARNMRQRGNKYHIAYPLLLITKFPTDNAAMVAAAGYINYLKKKNRRLAANGNLGI